MKIEELLKETNELKKTVINFSENIMDSPSQLQTISEFTAVFMNQINKFEQIILQDVAKNDIKISFITKIYTDGACSGNPGPGGYGYIGYENGIKIMSGSGHHIKTTNNRMEIVAVIMALKQLKKEQKAIIYTDSQLVANGANGTWKRKKNKDLWEFFDKASEDKSFSIIWEKRDTSEGNKIANKFAQKEAQYAKKS